MSYSNSTTAISMRVRMDDLVYVTVHQLVYVSLSLSRVMPQPSFSHSVQLCNYHTIIEIYFQSTNYAHEFITLNFILIHRNGCVVIEYYSTKQQIQGNAIADKKKQP